MTELGENIVPQNVQFFQTFGLNVSRFNRNASTQFIQYIEK